jgi:exopolysaccharide biosynthesis polyprenyl glycosylphosphotransferase
MKNRHQSILSKAHLWTDILLLNLSFIFAFELRFGNIPTLFQGHYLNLLLLSNLTWVFVIYLLRTYSFTRFSYNFFPKLLKLVQAITMHTGIIAILLYITKTGEVYSRTHIFSAYGYFLVGATLIRALSIYSLKLYRQAGFNSKTYAIVGNDIGAQQIDRFYKSRKELGYRLARHFDQFNEKEIGNLEYLMKSEKLDFVYCSMSHLSDAQLKSIIKLGETQKTQVCVIPDYNQFDARHTSIHYHDQIPVLQVTTKPFSTERGETLKRGFDLVFSSVVMVLGFPVFAAVMAAVKLTSEGPIFYRQKRCGQWGDSFYIYKFRSMCVNADKMGQHSIGDHDPRITPIGKFLRKSRLDEIPQFYNVLKGDMSIVGPRPLYKYDVDMLMEAEPHDFQRLLTVKPGITSIGQINVGYADTMAKNVERLKYDLQYLKSYSIRQDIILIFQTMQVMLLRKGQ